MSLEHAYKHLPAECVIWRVGQGKMQPVTLLPKGRFRNIISSCWRENPQKRPSFTQLLVVLEETVGLVVVLCMAYYVMIARMDCMEGTFAGNLEM